MCYLVVNLAMNIIPKSFDIETDLEIKFIIQTLSEQKEILGLDDALVF